MDILTRQQLRSLVEVRSGQRASILMPTYRTGRKTRQHRIRLKNLLGVAEQRLSATGLRRPEIIAMLEPAQRVLRDGLFWSHQGDGLAVYLAPGVSHLFRLPLEVPELVVVSERFHVKPLLPLISGDGRFYLLAIGQKRIRLFQGSRHTMVQVELAGVTGSLVEALRGEDPQRQLQLHRTTRASGGRRERPAVYHGHGAGADDAIGRILRYFHQVDEAVNATLSGEQAPLVLVAVNYLLPIYREANSYPHVAEDAIGGSPEHLSRQVLHRRGWEVVAPLFAEAQQGAARRYNQAVGTGLAADTLETILPAAHHGQVEVLFVTVGFQQWGRFDPSANEVRLHVEEEPGDEDLLDLAAAQTFLNGGMVYAVAPEEVPGGAPLAALLRWESSAGGGPEGMPRATT
jgi:Bacterial archaeo-eukaryotic release factor family 7